MPLPASPDPAGEDQRGLRAEFGDGVGEYREPVVHPKIAVSNVRAPAGIITVPWTCEKRLSLFLSAFPMFVASLSW
jgi:hypothetical protein